jgi:hypothetical protein
LLPHCKSAAIIQFAPAPSIQRHRPVGEHRHAISFADLSTGYAVKQSNRLESKPWMDAERGAERVRSSRRNSRRRKGSDGRR